MLFFYIYLVSIYSKYYLVYQIFKVNFMTKINFWCEIYLYLFILTCILDFDLI